MTTYVIGLGNPGPEYAGTRHNAGRMTAQNFAEKSGFGEFKPEKKIALVSTGKLRKNFVISILPELYMNNSGKAVAGFVKPKKSLPNVIVLHDDVDLPLGRFKIVFNRGSGGHKGVESVIRALKTEAFVRVRVGISPKKKPNHRELLKFLTSPFKPSELKILKTISKKVLDALEMIVAEGHEKAMSLYNK